MKTKPIGTRPTFEQAKSMKLIDKYFEYLGKIFTTQNPPPNIVTEGIINVIFLFGLFIVFLFCLFKYFIITFCISFGVVCFLIVNLFRRYLKNDLR